MVTYPCPCIRSVIYMLYVRCFISRTFGVTQSQRTTGGTKYSLPCNSRQMKGGAWLRHINSFNFNTLPFDTHHPIFDHISITKTRSPPPIAIALQWLLAGGTQIHPVSPESCHWVPSRSRPSLSTAGSAASGRYGTAKRRYATWPMESGRRGTVCSLASGRVGAALPPRVNGIL